MIEEKDKEKKEIAVNIAEKFNAIDEKSKNFVLGFIQGLNMANDVRINHLQSNEG